jgi:membrane protein DedA with SNARE-associated domain
VATRLAGRRAPLCHTTKAVTAAASATSTSLQLLLGSLLEGLGLPIPAELLLITAPVAGLAGGPALALATGGYLAGAAGAYWGGERGGARAIERIAGIAGMGPAEGDRLGALFRRWGPLMGLVGRFLPPIRAASLWAAGALRIEPRLYFPAVALSTLLYNGLWLAAGLSVAHRLERVFGWFNWLGGGVLLTLLLIRVVRLVRTRQGRGGLW